MCPWEKAATAPSNEVIGHIFRTRGRVLVEAGWRGVYGELAEIATGAADFCVDAAQKLARAVLG